MSSIEPGAIIDGKYRVVRRIGEGGMGTVYEGENVRIERRVAIKVLHEHVASSPEFAERFEREARASARVGSEHVCDVLDLGDLPNGERYLVMEFLDGESLEDRLERGLLTAAELAPIAFQILEGLGTMHLAGVIHRDLKPANVFLARRKASEVVKILDFGVAKIQPRADQPSAMTSTGMMMGTPLYMSPEQARGARDVDGRTDIYAASVIFYRALTGQMPHTGANLNELLFKIVLEDAKPIREIVPDVDEAFAAIVTKGLARAADLRFTSAREFQEELVAWGKAQNDPNLLFSITLSNRPPPLESLTGGYPAERLAAAAAASERAGPPTPQGVGVAAGTPMNWAGATVEGGLYPSAHLKTLESREGIASKTQVMEPSRRLSQPLAAAAATASTPPRGRGPAALAVTLGVALVVGGGVWLSSSNKGGGVVKPVGLAVSAPAAQEIPPTPSAEPTVAVQTIEPRALPEASASTSAASAAPVVPQRPVAKASNPVGATTKAAAGASDPAGAVSAPVVTAPPPTTATGHRKFRTDLN